MSRYDFQRSALSASRDTSLCAGGSERRLIRDLLPAATLFAILIAALSVAYLRDAGAKGQYLVVAPPDWPLVRTINLVVSTDGRLIGTGRFSNMLFVASRRADFQPALRHAGAWLVIPMPVPLGCYGASANGRPA